MQVQFLNRQNKFPVESSYEAIDAALRLAYERNSLAKAAETPFKPSVSVTFVNEKVMRETNRETRGIAKVTDVLSFPLLEMKEGELLKPLTEADFYPEEPSDSDSKSESDSETEVTYILELGDIVICAPRAQAQAEAYGHSFLRELTFLALHGMLHLLGYDHEEGEAQEAKMFGIQEEILNELGITRDGTEGSLPLGDFAIADQNLPEGFKSGFVAIVGRPNAGKSTLLNRLSGDELAIVTPKAQTTRHNIRTVLDDGTSQIIFIDTPGIHRSSNKLDRYMTDSAWFALQDADVGLLLVDPEKGFISEVEKACTKKAAEFGIPLILLLTKTDALAKESLLPVISRYAAFYDFADIIPISATANDNIDLLLAKIRELLPEGPRYYHEDSYTDQTERALAAEYIREQILHYMHQEIPYAAAVEIDSFKEEMDESGERRLVRILASIITEKDSHKGMIIGKKGQSLKRIGTAARIKLEELLGCKVYLELHVKVRPDWQNKDEILNQLGYVKGKAGPSAEDIM